MRLAIGQIIVSLDIEGIYVQIQEKIIIVECNSTKFECPSTCGVYYSMVDSFRSTSSDEQSKKNSNLWLYEQKQTKHSINTSARHINQA